ncbi:hypothetical protein WNY77_16755, partial [Paraglaciecola mesophila]
NFSFALRNYRRVNTSMMIGTQSVHPCPAVQPGGALHLKRPASPTSVKLFTLSLSTCNDTVLHLTSNV